MNGKKYDIVFWAYNAMVVDRCLPLMVSLNKKGYHTLLFYQDYDICGSESPAQELLFRKHNIDILTYSDFLRKSFLLQVTTMGLGIIRNTYLHNKLRGFRFKLLVKKINENLIRGILEHLGHKLNIYDSINVAKHVEYPLGSYYIKKISDDMNIEGIAIPHGIRTHYQQHVDGQKIIDFNEVIVSNEKEREYTKLFCTEYVKDITPIGDPRYDALWKSELRSVFRGKMGNIFSEEGKLKVLYLLPSMEQFGMETEVYSALGKIASMAALSGNIKLFIRPHPRHRHKDKISKTMRKNGLQDFEILGNDPLIAYAEKADYIISPVSSALFDFIPEMAEKVIIYYDFPKADEFTNIFRGYINFFEDIESLSVHLKNGCKNSIVTKEEMERFCDEWAANGQGLDTIIDRYIELIENKLK